jgi:HK97 family phage prohead protease
MPLHFPTEVFHRSSTVNADTVDFTDRIIEVVALPWDVEAPVVWRGEMWQETFQRGAFNDAIDAGVRIPVNREHVRGDTIGRVVSMVDHPHGLLAAVKIAKTARGDDTLQLAAEGVLGASVGYKLQKLSDVVLNRRAMTRRVMRAFMDHLGMVESPAFAGADTLAVHDEFSHHPEAGLQPLVTPTLDEMAQDEIFSWANQRLGK